MCGNVGQFDLKVEIRSRCDIFISDVSVSDKSLLRDFFFHCTCHRVRSVEANLALKLYRCESLLIAFPLHARHESLQAKPLLSFARTVIVKQLSRLLCVRDYFHFAFSARCSNDLRQGPRTK